MSGPSFGEKTVVWLAARFDTGTAALGGQGPLVKVLMGAVMILSLPLLALVFLVGCLVDTIKWGVR
jgi:hypothetical protein